MVMAFVAQHAAEYASIIKEQMVSAHGRLQLMKEIADLAAQIELAKNRSRWDIANDAIGDFMKDNKEAWHGGERDMSAWWDHTHAWTKGKSIVTASYKQVAHPDAEDGRNSWKGDWQWGKSVDSDSAKDQMASWISELHAWKDELAGKDKLALMELSDSSSRLNELYQLGSNLNSKHHEAAMTIIANMGR